MTSGNQPSAEREVTKRLGELSVPYWVVSGSIVVGAIASIVVGAFATHPEVAKTFQTGVTPILTMFAGGVFNDFYHRLSEDKHLTGDVRKSADATLIMLENVVFVEKRLAEASGELNEENWNGASTSVQVALAMTTATLRQVRQNLRLWKSLSPKAVEQARAEFNADEDDEDATAIEPPKREEIAMGSGESRKVDDKDG